VTDPPFRVFYRVVESNPPTLWDFTSNQAKGLTLQHPTPQTLRWWAGVSIHDTEARARSLARQRPSLGQFIAQLRIPDDGSIPYERTGTRRGHHTVWGEPAALLARVVAVVAV
jgi:hypothetical protein